jgi:hypothetical protein
MVLKRFTKTLGPPPMGKWPGDALLREARSRMRTLVNDNNARIQTMLRDLLVEACWTQDEFLNALVKDVADHGEARWSLAPSNPLTAVTAHQASSRSSSHPGPKRTKSGVMAKATVPHTPAKKAAG